MKFKKAYYRNRIINPKYATKDNWLRLHKDRYYRWATSAMFQDAFGIKIKPKRRHKRSIAIRDLKQLLSWDEKTFEELNCWCEHGVTCSQIKKHRIYVYTY